MTSKDFKEFRQITQGKKLEIRKAKKDWWHPIFTFFSRYISWFLAKTSITPNTITLVGLIIGLSGLLLIVIGNNILIIIGFILLYLFFLFDEVDGEVARAKKQTSLHGIIYDEISHLLFQGWYFFAFGFYIFQINSKLLYLFLCIIASFFLLGIRITSKIPVFTYTNSAAENILKNIQEKDIEIQKSKKGFIKFIKFLILNLVTAFSNTIIITTIFLIGFVIYLNFGSFQLIELTLIVYSVFMPIVFFSYLIKNVITVEKEVLEIHKSLNKNDM